VAKLRVVLLIVALAVSYDLLLTPLLGYASAIAIPNWWMDALPSRLTAFRLWEGMSTLLAVLPAALGVALVAKFLSPRNSLGVASAAAIAGVPISYVFLDASFRALFVTSFGFASFLDSLIYVALPPLLVKGLSWLPSNYRLERP